MKIWILNCGKYPIFSTFSNISQKKKTFNYFLTNICRSHLLARKWRVRVGLKKKSKKKTPQASGFEKTGMLKSLLNKNAIQLKLHITPRNDESWNENNQNIIKENYKIEINLLINIFLKYIIYLFIYMINTLQKFVQNTSGNFILKKY